ncbi:carboxymuconolactone decarboxylase family protein [Proteus faecis]|uniref:Carboxymuconolactone decarboxylase family protein n=1 Tax=Proteus faecis TaxID=2050967 RepID=A0AAW7CPG0_9GAMM|nr:carboxymuconolactone decarboxylase family protein [Proteus faecis]MBG3014656.1 carboxymuconolactone decarboxylase family protein [Proteus mirabilis]MDO5405391.1 carboxymuconolactone decarboxylase family protein [Proteus sp. (in: enterobacteria)]QNH66487.1 carboxymuconolactone decarboxylase family protein [Proteus vulgaris]MCT8250004.1 carboxymuconolactone decarboxylase family protein [Proteus faecis]MDL5167564.1 carboxymuconolactone decarboxylase family protein [Proteus faecis]
MSKYKEIVTDIASNMGTLSQNIPDVMKAFMSTTKAGGKEGALDAKTKELIAIAIAVANRCDGCIGFHTKTLVELGTTEQELAEALGVAIYMGGGPSVMYASNTMGAFKEFSK